MLITDWKKVLTQAWSSRLAIIAGLLSATEYGLQYVAPEHSSASFVLIAAIVSFAAAVARIVAQPALHDDDQAADE